MIRLVPAILLIAGPAAAQSIADARDLIRPDWRIEYEVMGDISRDGVPDLAVVLKQTDPANVITHDGLGENPYDSNPRELMVALGQRGGGFRVVARNDRVISRREMPTMNDPLQDAPAIENGVLKFTLVAFMSAGGWGAGNTTFSFRHQDGMVRLIGFDDFSFQRNSGQSTETSINLLTGRRSVTTGDMGEDEPSEDVVWDRVRLGPVNLTDMGDGFMWAYETFGEE